MVHFLKMNGNGNDFVIIDNRKEKIEITPKITSWIGYRRFGIGCDQLILLEDSTKADIFMRIYNADGSQSAACGNATRCIADLLMRQTGKPQASIETLAGVLVGVRAGADEVTVNMGEPKLEWNQIPLSEEMDVMNLPITVGPLSNPTAVSMGNPHMVFFVPDINKIRLRNYGSELENNPLFPQKANVTIATICSREYIATKVWERGVGKTLACGTAACATLVAGVLNNLVEPKAVIEQPGGTLKIEWLENGQILMTGKASYGYEGDFDLAVAMK
jgi:diaminopimelate epimerase